MHHNAYINPKILNSFSGAVHINPNFTQSRNVYVNPLFIQNKPNGEFGESSAPVAEKYSKYTWRKKTDGEQTRILQPTNNVATKCGKKLMRKEISPLRPYQSTSKTKIAQGHPFKTAFKLDKRSSDVRRRSALKKTRTEKISRVNSSSANKRLINIGGILYRATSNKLTRAPAASSSSSLPIKNDRKTINKLVINVRGERFMLSKNGATLKKMQSQCVTRYPRQRIDFGGVTFKQTTDNIYVRTNAHYVRSVLAQARQKSIAFLAARRRKINTPCEVFRKLGRCARHQSGICVFTHDKKTVDLCKRFLQGKCTDKTCVLSHNVVHQKVPTCKFFLDGSCGRDNCPYLHVKVSERADICLPFLQGYCALGDQCSQRHVNTCPEFEKTKRCKKGKQCPYPHKKVTRNVKPKTKRKSKRLARKPIVEEDGIRYYAAESESLGKEVIVPKRLRLDALPSFIALNST